MAAEPGPTEQQYSLRWNDFHSAILSSFRHLRDEEDFVDVTLACDGCSFSAHKVVLSACSPYFRKLLKANPCQHPIVILRDIQKKDMESLLKFMYNGEVHIGQEQLGDFLKAAQMLQVRGLADVPTPGVPMNNIDRKVSPSSTNMAWPDPPLSDSSREKSRSRKDGHSPPPSKRTRSSDLYNAQLRNRVETLNLHNHRSPDISINNGLDLRDSLLSQALEGGPTSHSNNMKMNSENSLQTQSTGEDSSSDAALSDNESDLPPRHAPKQEPQDYSAEDMGLSGHNGSLLDPQRNPNFPGALLGLQGLLPGPSGMHGTPDNFDAAVLPSDHTASQIIKADAPVSPDAVSGESILCPQPEQKLSYLENDIEKFLMSSSIRNSLILKQMQNEGDLDCPLCGIYLTFKQARHHINAHYPRDSPLCPVTSCGRLFAHPNSVRNHMRIKHPEQWDKMKSLKWSYGGNS